jgi:hypothetical protein
MPDIFGRISPMPFAYYDPASRCWRTFQATFLSGLDKYTATWPASGTTRTGIASRLPPLVPRTSATESLLWPTPVAHDDGKTPEAHLAMKARMPGGPRSTITSLTVMIKAVERGMWPTPNASDYKGATTLEAAKDWDQRGTNLPEAVQRSGGPTGQLNPTWVEWLMGFPPGWTDLNVSGTPSSPKSPNGSDNKS